MRLEHYSQNRLEKEIAAIVGKYLSLDNHRLFFFGSRVVNGGSAHSDIDVGIEGPDRIPFRVLRQIREELENLPTLYSIDIVDFQSASSEFRLVAMQHVEDFESVA